MRLTRYAVTALLVSSLLTALSLLTGCAKKEDDDFDIGPLKGGKGANLKAHEKGYGKGVVKGYVRLGGGGPDMAAKNAEQEATMRKGPAQDIRICIDQASPGEREYQAWRVGKDKGVGNVVVMLRPADGYYFALDDKHPGVARARTDAKSINDVADKVAEMKDADQKAAALKNLRGPGVIDQPHCAFVPHVNYVFPTYTDAAGKKQATGQRLRVLNTSETGHNTKWGDNTNKNPGSNETISARVGNLDFQVNPSDKPIMLSCSVHPWMNAYAWVVDHPFIAVTDENGYFEIKNVPIGKVQIVAWHESDQYFNDNGKKGEEVDLPADGAVEKNFSASYR